jgi:hypothetical protein
MKNSILITFILSILTLSCDSQGQEFKSLFNGKDLTNWTIQKPGSFEVIDEELITRSSGPGTDIYSEKAYSNFILRLEFLLSEVGNSGVFIRRDPEVPDSGFEVQLLAPWTPWRDDLHCTGSLYGHVAITNRPDETTGKWYKMEIKCDRNKVSVSVNDQITTIADIDTVKTLADKPLTGYIGFQGNHAEKPGQFARFRNIRMLDLDSEPEYVIEGFKNSDWQVRQVSGRSAVKLGAAIIQSMADMMSANDPMLKSEAKQVLFDIVAQVSDPSVNEKERKKVRREIEKSLKVSSSEITSNYLEWIMGMIQ